MHKSVAVEAAEQAVRWKTTDGSTLLIVEEVEGVVGVWLMRNFRDYGRKIGCIVYLL